MIYVVLKNCGHTIRTCDLTHSQLQCSFQFCNTEHISNVIRLVCISVCMILVQVFGSTLLVFLTDFCIFRHKYICFMTNASVVSVHYGLASRFTNRQVLARALFLSSVLLQTLVFDSLVSCSTSSFLAIHSLLLLLRLLLALFLSLRFSFISVFIHLSGPCLSTLIGVAASMALFMVVYSLAHFLLTSDSPSTSPTPNFNFCLKKSHSVFAVSWGCHSGTFSP